MKLLLAILAATAWAADAAIYLERARAAQARGEIDDAVAAYEAVLRLKGESPVVRHSLALIYLRAGALERAIGEARRAVELEPKNGRYRTTLASVILAQKDPDLDAANAHLRRAVSLLKRERDHPWLARAYYSLGTIAKKKRKLELARSYFNRAFVHNPADGDVRAALRVLDPAALRD